MAFPSSNEASGLLTKLQSTRNISQDLEFPSSNEASGLLTKEHSISWFMEKEFPSSNEASGLLTKGILKNIPFHGVSVL